MPLCNQGVSPLRACEVSTFRDHPEVAALRFSPPGQFRVRKRFDPLLEPSPVLEEVAFRDPSRSIPHRIPQVEPVAVTQDA